MFPFTLSSERVHLCRGENMSLDAEEEVEAKKLQLEAASDHSCHPLGRSCCCSSPWKYVTEKYRITETSIVDACIRVKGRWSKTCTCINDACTCLRIASYTHALRSRIIYMRHGYMHHHTYIGVKDLDQVWYSRSCMRIIRIKDRGS